MDYPQNPDPNFPLLIEDWDLSEFMNLSDYLLLQEEEEEEDGNLREQMHLPVFYSPTSSPDFQSSLQTVLDNLDVDRFVDGATTPGNN